jgi:glutaconate CoA-transferase subunit A
MGAYPTACYGYYDYDPSYLNAYRDQARDTALHQAYLERCIFGVADHQAFMDLQDAKQLERIKADPQKGYAIGLDRK